MTVVPIVFTDADTPEAKDLLQKAYEQHSQPLPQTGIIFKVLQLPDGSEQLVNWQIADAAQVEAIALGLTVSAQS
jgi:hypothetical protein